VRTSPTLEARGRRIDGGGTRPIAFPNLSAKSQVAVQLQIPPLSACTCTGEKVWEKRSGYLLSDENHLCDKDLAIFTGDADLAIHARFRYPPSWSQVAAARRFMKGSA
jgi:hypothetical protein